MTPRDPSDASDPSAPVTSAASMPDRAFLDPPPPPPPHLAPWVSTIGWFFGGIMPMAVGLVLLAAHCGKERLLHPIDTEQLAEAVPAITACVEAGRGEAPISKQVSVRFIINTDAVAHIDGATSQGKVLPASTLRCLAGTAVEEGTFREADTTVRDEVVPMSLDLRPEDGPSDRYIAAALVPRAAAVRRCLGPDGLHFDVLANGTATNVRAANGMCAVQALAGLSFPASTTGRYDVAWR